MDNLNCDMGSLNEKFREVCGRLDRLYNSSAPAASACLYHYYKSSIKKRSTVAKYVKLATGETSCVFSLSITGAKSKFLNIGYQNFFGKFIWLWVVSTNHLNIYQRVFYFLVGSCKVLNFTFRKSEKFLVFFSCG